MAVTLTTRLRDVVARTAPKLEKARGITTVGELLDFLPRSYLDPARPSDFATLADGEDVVLMATVKQAVTRRMRNRRGSMLIATVVDEQGGELDLTFFKPYGHEQALVPGRRVVCSGTVSSFQRRRQLTHPDYQVVGPRRLGDPGLAQALESGLVPVYTATKGVNAVQMISSVQLALHALEDVPDPVPATVRARRGLPDLLTAYWMVHQPETEAEQRKARWRLKFQEAFVIQAALAQRRMADDAVRAVPRRAAQAGLVEAFRRRLPFDLTAGQQEVLASVTADLAGDSPMHRLLQGEVGSGKTVVALLAMLTVIDGGGQAALLAPTEVLAQQHHRSITAMLGPLAEAGLLGGVERATRVALLTGSQPVAERRANLLMAASGEAGIVVGTHALIQEHVQFAELGLVVVDEQHRFGVEQRDALRAKAGDAPHVLVMTATPIPRTVAMTVYGDMEISTLRELPAGRQPITTHVVPGELASWVDRTWRRVAEEAAKGHRAYVVCPRIGEEQDPDLDAETGPGGPVAPAEGQEGKPLHGVLQVHRALQALPATSGLRIGLLHGRMAPADKEAVMGAFAAGDLDVLVATTVIEVGVDVRDATVMVVLDADRFGISQLHQLRGRVGRGDQPGLCLLMTQELDGPSQERLDAVAATTDGFVLARVDLEQRREGDVLGAAQSGGRSGLRFLRLARDEELIVGAHEDAWAVVEDDPDLVGHPALREEIARLDAERAAFLERG
ncbi:ATP-dependent DNA helicase RecG [Ornithinimicrobium sediminis]|uniref:ATP-dependent DNA helicase RecG n=1 Tax=Ornithinimicrobium sediminis TaxID=2904603 RepID=UPI001E29ACB3|nr:ATP-dependent DNA helicase RecG [Ornithinimicrobium sediminis]MCE0486607.1 ATP-dependent DNA helicase RecG [Ornithinimicrobium sediminis]